MWPDRDWIAARIPHSGTMCLLDGVSRWDATHIVCCASSHRHADNPLRAEGALGIANGIEYAAQAMAVHSALLGGDGGTPAAGFLTSVRDVVWIRERLDDIHEDLQIKAERLMGDAVTAMYQIRVEAAGQLLLSGRISVMMDATGRSAT